MSKLRNEPNHYKEHVTISKYTKFEDVYMNTLQITSFRKSRYLLVLVPRASRPRVSSLGPGTHGTESARKLAVVSKAHAFALGLFSTRNNFHREVLRINEVFVLTYVDRIIFPSENCSISEK